MLSDEEEAAVKREIGEAMINIVKKHRDAKRGITKSLLTTITAHTAHFSAYMASGANITRDEWINLAAICCESNWTNDGKPTHRTLDEMESTSGQPDRAADDAEAVDPKRD